MSSPNNNNISLRFNQIEEMLVKIQEKLEQTPAIIISRITEEIKSNNHEVKEELRKNKGLERPIELVALTSSNMKYGGLKWAPPVTEDIGSMPKLTFIDPYKNPSLTQRNNKGNDV